MKYLIKNLLITICLIYFTPALLAATITVNTLDGTAGAVGHAMIDASGNVTFPGDGTIVIEAGVEDGNCNLIEAVEAANTDTVIDSCVAGSGDDDIVFSLSGTIPLGRNIRVINPLPLSGGFATVHHMPTIESNITLQGHPQGTVLEATNINTALLILAEDTVTVSDIEIRSAGPIGPQNYFFDQLLGFAVEVKISDLIATPATVNLENLHVHNNLAGGIGYIKSPYNIRESLVTIKDSLIENNTNDFLNGAGIYMNECFQLLASDKRLKTDITPLGKSPSGIPTYSYRYKEADKKIPNLNSNNLYKGVIAQDLLSINPKAVSLNRDGFYRVNYSLIDVDFSILDKSNKSNFKNKANNHYTLEVINSMIRTNTGGGIANDCGHLKVIDSTISGNINGNSNGFGIYIDEGENLPADEMGNPPFTAYQTLTEISNSTITNNESFGIQIENLDELLFSPAIILKHNTISENFIELGGNIGANTTIDISNTVLSNTVGGFGFNCYNLSVPGGAIPLNQNINNLSSDASCGFAQENVNIPLFSALDTFPSDNGASIPIGPNGLLGNVFTFAIDANSPLYNAADTSQCLPADERGVLRPQAGLCDIGAFEFIPPDLVTTKIVDNSTPNEGDTIVYTITIINNGPGLSTNVILVDLLPAGVTYVSDDSDISGQTYDPLTGIWSIGDMDITGVQILPVVINITATVDAGTNGTTITNTVTVPNDGIPTGDDLFEDILVVPAANLALTKTLIDSSPYTEGDIISYQIQVTNNGSLDATNVIIDDTPNGVTISTVTGAGCNAIPCNIASIVNGETITVTVTATIDALAFSSTGSTFTNTATVSASETDPDTTDNSDSVTENSCGIGEFQNRGEANSNIDTMAENLVDVVCSLIQPNITIAKTSIGGVDTFAFSETNTATASLDITTITDGVTVVGNQMVVSDNLTDVVVTENLPIMWGLTSAECVDNNNANTSNPATPFGSLTGLDLTIPSSNLVSAADIVCTFINTALVPELSVTKTAVISTDANSNGLADEGDIITFSVTVQNTGTADLDTLVVNDAMGGGVLNCIPTTLIPTQIATCTDYTYTVLLSDIVNGGTIDNTASAEANDPSNNPVTGSDTTQTPIVPSEASIGIVKTLSNNADEDSSSSITLNDTLTFTIVTTNTGNIGLNNVTITDSMIIPNSATCATVMPNTTCELIGDYVVTESDVLAGVINNTAVAVSDETNATPVSDNVSIAVQGSISPVIIPINSLWVRLIMTTMLLMFGVYFIRLKSN